MEVILTNLIPSAPLTMTSREIAELTGKRHDNILRDIDTLILSLSSEMRNGFESSVYESGNPPREYRQYILDRDSTYCLIAGYDATARMKIIKRWQALESGEATPAFQAKPVHAAAYPPAKLIAETFKSCHAVAKLCGLKANMAAMSADIGTKRRSGSEIAFLSRNPRHC